MQYPLTLVSDALSPGKICFRTSVPNVTAHRCCRKNKMKSNFAVFCIVRAEFLSIWRGSSNARVCKRLGSIYVEARIVPERSRNSECLWAGRSGDRIPVGARFFAFVQTDPEAHPSPFTMGTGSFPRLSCGRGVTLTPHPLLVPRSKIE
jgi:hypothetical protein